ncbi:ABC transporter ATP-binding protein [Slackia exigua]|uniref:ABC transporter, ATP-binding protein n=1 Tax=Slackia exigua (strain ATCC 700122 / DSM 15923 / CIP 105133 / JCM 11022 / KCTC 5966 / S-7) TaxID=649764 RepID=D0WF88_SLAES|nr:ABC transporter ATP-binding protein [Slackia exigua]EEZ61772.1 ABC transporter, ATP-binding protein [Slackia exigua ATCC 700122]STN98764.1 Putative HMP/thiamine import ATP-binding protein YkoD [Slackia exigua]
MIKIENVTYTYPEAVAPALKEVSLSVADGECVLLCGKSGCGKSSVIRLINGMIPNFYEGELTGSVLHDGRLVSELPLYAIAEKTGTVFQNPRTQFYTVNTTSEIAFGCENLGMPRERIVERVQRTVEDLEIEDLMDRSIFELSGGEKQIVAFASVYAMRPSVYVLDEPSANLDMSAVERLRRILALLKRQGATIVIAEHRLFYLRDLFDRAVCMEDGRVRAEYTQSELAAFDAAERERMGLRFLSLAEAPVRASNSDVTAAVRAGAVPGERLVLSRLEGFRGKQRVLCVENETFEAGRIHAVVGPNGAGKSTFAAALCATLKKASADCSLDGERLSARRRLKLSYLVMQEVGHQIFSDSVETEVTLGSREADEAARARKLEHVLDDLDLSGLEQRHPMTLSGGQKQRVIIASACFSGKRVLLFDEPTSGLDYAHMLQTARILRRLRDAGAFIFVITHDYELIAEVCDEVVHLKDGAIRERYDMDEAGVAKLKRFFGM